MLEAIVQLIYEALKCWNKSWV